jgi:DNA-binding SARP family transcriptional activator
MQGMRLTRRPRSLQMAAGFARGQGMATASVGDGAQGSAAPRLVLTGAAAVVCRADATRVALARLDAALLAYLAVEGVASRQRLLQLLWPDEQPDDARNALRQRLFRLRRSIGVEIVHGSEQLSLAAGVAHDINDEHGEGELLAGFHYADCRAFDVWLSAQRRSRQSRRRARYDERIDACEREARFAEGAVLAERIVAADPLDEPAVRCLMRLRYLAGQRAAAVDAFERFAAALEEDGSGAAPARETNELLAMIRDTRMPVPVRKREIPVSVLRPPRLVGRDAELRSLAAAWSGQRAFWLLGEAGLGKTRLIGEFVADANAALVVAARPGDAGVPYASFGRALRMLLERRPLLLERAERGELARVMPELQVVSVAPPPAIGLAAVLQRAIRSLLQGAWNEGLAALVFDDLHFADSASLEMLQALVGDDALAGLRWGFAQRPAEGLPAVEALRAALEEAQRIDMLTLAPLDERQMAELIDSLAVPDLDAAPLSALLVRHTGGNPMYALETIKHLILSDGPGLDAKLPRPASVGQLIERRLRALTPAALQLARVAAVAGADFTIEMAESVLDTRALALADAWRELEAAHVLRGDVFAHDLVHEATLAAIPVPIAAHTHGAVAAWLEAHDGAPARVASHWLDAAQPRRAVSALHAAADAAKRAMRRKEEAAFLVRAARIESDVGADSAFDSWRAMIDATWAVDLTALDASMFDCLQAAATTPRRRAAAHALRANWLQECGDLVQAKRLARGAIELADAAGDEPTAADARQRLAEMLDWDGDYDAALALLQPLLPWAAERASDYEQAEFYCRLAIVLDNTDRGREARVYHQRAIDKARKTGEWGGVVTILGNLAISWATAGVTQRAIDVLREAMQLAAAHDEARGCAASLPPEMYNALRDCGRYEEALRWIEPALAAEPGARKALIRCHVACGWMHLGQHARAQREIDAALAMRVTDWTRAKALQMRARLKLALGQPGAGALLDEALRLVLAQHGRGALRASIALDRALALDPADALAAARDVIAEGERLDLPGTTLAGHIRATRFAVEAGSAAEGETHARAALAIGDDVSPNDLYPAERWLNAWRALRLASRDDEAHETLQRGVGWVRETKQAHVPQSFHDSFVRANAVNLHLLRAAASVR